MKVNWHGLAAFFTTAIGVALSPAVLNVVPPKYAAAIIALGAVYQAVTKPAAAVGPVSAPEPQPAQP